jgi:hypothetical protein
MRRPPRATSNRTHGAAHAAFRGAIAVMEDGGETGLDDSNRE